MKVKAIKQFFRHGYCVIKPGHELDLMREEALNLIKSGKVELVRDVTPNAEAATLEPPPAPERRRRGRPRKNPST